MLKLALSIVVTIAACGEVPYTATDAGTDGNVAPPDAATVLPASGRELAVAAGRLSGGSWTVDVQLGSVTDQSRLTGGAFTATSAAPLNP